MRRSPLPGLVEVLQRNLSRGFKNLAILRRVTCSFRVSSWVRSPFRRWVLVLLDEVLADLDAGIPAAAHFHCWPVCRY